MTENNPCVGLDVNKNTSVDQGGIASRRTVVRRFKTRASECDQLSLIASLVSPKHCVKDEIRSS